MNELILVVEDSRTQAMYLESILQSQDYRTAIAVDGEKALEWLFANSPALVISDITMPVMNGYELCRKIKTQSATQDIPVILMTSLSGPEEVIEGLIAGADSFITKPYDKEYLISHIEKILAEKKGVQTEKKEFGVEIIFEGKKRFIQTEQQQIIKLLLNIYDGAIQQNSMLLQTQEQLRFLNENLESLVEERTLALSEETKLSVQIAQKLKESEEKWRSLVTTIPDYIALHDREGRFLFLNHYAEGFSEKDIIGKTLFDFISYESKEICSQKFENCLNTGEDQAFEYNGLGDNRSMRIYESTFVPILLQGKVTNVMSIARDITARKLTEESLLQEQLFSNSLIDSLPGIFYLYRYPELRLIRWNKNHETLLGYEHDELIDRLFSDWVDPKTTDFIPEAVRKITENGHYLFESYLLTKDCRSIPFILTGVKFEVQDQKYIMGFGIEATELKKAEAEIKLKNEELQKINAEKDKFFSIIAHDLRSPFSALLGFSEVMVKELPDLTQKELQGMAEMLQKSASNLYRLLNNLLEWSQVQQGSMPFNPAAIRLRLLTDESLAMVYDVAKRKGIKMVCDIQEDLEIFADEHLLQTVMRNLVSNAVKFTSYGGQIILSAKLIAGNSVEVGIRDTGIGMNQEMVANLFRLDIKTNRIGTDGEPSSGLGLLLCKEFVEKHGGKLWVESEKGKGSVFRFSIPGKVILENLNPVDNIPMQAIDL